MQSQAEAQSIKNSQADKNSEELVQKKSFPVKVSTRVCRLLAFSVIVESTKPPRGIQINTESKRQKQANAKTQKALNNLKKSSTRSF